MRRFCYAPNTCVRIDGIPMRFVTMQGDGEWQLVETLTNRLVTKTTSQLDTLYASGALVLDAERADDARKLDDAKKRRAATSITDRTEAEQQRIAFRSAVLDAVDARTAAGVHLRSIVVLDDGQKTTALETILAEISKELGRSSPVSVPTYYRWKADLAATEDRLDLAGRCACSGRHNQLHPRVRRLILDTMREKLDDARENKGAAGHSPTCTMRSIRNTVDDLLRLENRRDPAANLTMPSLQTFYRLWNEFPAYDRDVAKFGKAKARRMYRGRSSHEGPEACLDLVEYDETKLPFFFFDETFGVPLGRAWLNWNLDDYSNIPVGFYLGFEPPSDLSIASALRHACLPKAYVQTTYPDIQNTLPAAGIPRLLIFDNGLSQYGESIRTITYDLNIPYKFTRVYTPWFKSAVENAFNLLNKLLLQEMPGFVLGNIIDKQDYDPAKNGCIGLRHFLYIFHKWLIDIYCSRPMGTWKITPRDRWNEGVRARPPEFLERATDLDLLFGIVRTATVDHRGVTFRGLSYYSDGLHAFRRQYGRRTKVRVKIDPSNLSVIHVFEPKERFWIRVEALNKHYTQGLSLHRHELNLKWANERYGREDIDALQQAQWDLQQLISDALPMALSIRTNTLIARTFGVGTQHIFNNLDLNGNLGPLSGPFTGQSLNPFQEQASTSAPPTPAARPPEGGVRADAPPAPILAERPKRTIPVYDADLSIGSLTDHTEENRP